MPQIIGSGRLRLRIGNVQFWRMKSFLTGLNHSEIFPSRFMHLVDTLAQSSVNVGFCRINIAI